MSSNSKSRKRTLEAKTRNRTKGYKGPAKTQPKHNKKRAWFQLGNSNNPKIKKKDKEDES